MKYFSSLAFITSLAALSPSPSRALKGIIKPFSSSVTKNLVLSLLKDQYF